MKKIFITTCLLAGLSLFADQFTFNATKNKPVEKNPADWVEIDMSDWQVAEGSALDVSADYPAEMAGSKGRLIVNNQGKFAFESDPDTPVKFKGTNWRPGNFFNKGINSKEDIDKIAKGIRRAGYNLVRWRISMYAKKEFDAPYQMKANIRDLYDYCVFAFAREGVYSHFHLASHDLGNPDFKWKDRYDVKIKMIFGDKQTWEDWRKLVKMEFEHINPYTNKAWKDDCSIISTEYFNELEMGIIFRKKVDKSVAEFANKKFRKWLKPRFKNIDELNAKWKTSFKSFDEISPINTDDGSFKTKEFSHFFMQKSQAMQEFCQRVFREELGCKTLVHQYNCGVRPDLWYMSAMSGDYMAMNTYMRSPKGPIDKLFRYWRSASAKRVLGMPMHITEYQHLLDVANGTAHETGVLFPAYCALQDYDALTVHDCGVYPDAKDLFNTTANPILRANEFLSHCMFYRGDVRASKNRFDIIYTKKFMREDGATWRTPLFEQTKVGFLTQIAGDWQDIDKQRPAPKCKSPYASMTQERGAYLGSTTGAEFNLEAFVEQMRKDKILPESNITDVKNGVFQSDTGEIIMRKNEMLGKVITARTEAIALKANSKNETLCNLAVKSTSTDASVAVCSIDKKPIAKSKHMVFVYATESMVNAINLTKGQKIPTSALIKVGKLEASLKVKNPQKFKLYALAINGKRMCEIPLTATDSSLNISIDTKNTPSVFFELVAK